MPAAPAYEEYAVPSARPVDLGESEYAYEPHVPAEAPRVEEEEEVPGAAPVRKGGLDARVLIGVGFVALLGIGFGAYKLLQPKPSAPPPAAAAPAPVRPAPAGEDPIAKAQGLFDQGKVDEALQLLVSVPDADPRHAEVLAMIDRIKSSAIPTPPAAAPSDATLDEMRVTGLAAVAASRYIDAVKTLDPVVKARPEDTEAAQGLAKAREELAALSAAIRAYNEQDYGSSIKLLWDLRKRDMKNQDVEEFLFKSYFNEGIQSLQAGNFKGATTSFQEASQLRPQDAEAKRHAAFARKYSGGTTDLLSRVYVKNLQMRP
ncbi:MAG: hypothetical protein DYH06_14270 [Acidobacteria bacterium ACB2]|nr:hypothetical protein [Acidobacteria bacterium ACB2]